MTDTLKKSFNITEAILMARLSSFAYKNFEKDHLAFSMDLSSIGFRMVGPPIVDAETNTQACLVRNDDFGVLCFRGTYEFPADAFTDLAARLTNGGHEGFFRSLASVSDQIQSAFDNVGDLPLFATGHSLGGALAKAAILTFPERNWKACYTFGSPPICDEARSKNNIVPTSLIVNVGDIVSRVMDLDQLTETGVSLLSGLFKSLRRADIDQPLLDQAEDYVNAIGKDSKKYCHFGEVHLFDVTGRSPTKEESMDAFKRIVRTDWRRALDDHQISRYISNLEKYRDNRIV